MLANDKNGGALTARELEVLRLIAAEKADKEIASQLQVSERTVRYYLESIHEKLGTMTRVGAVAKAIRLNLI
ncbi:MAG: response regulator transcription factor [Ardenticatenaceae bacterium]|nr:response regulator transcription factor [Anaerolineales bacterium]MCB8938655.1 response regulator transcription factor [Ardenticatenaceae bacterium]MCB8973891.1 response regulator transcription factor [Ardenticatenaceae bacterium]